MPQFEEGDDEDKGLLAYKVPWGHTAPYDARFHGTDQMPMCIRYYMDYHRCKSKKGDDYPDCNYYKYAYQATCFSKQVEKWNEQRENGTFPYKIDYKGDGKWSFVQK